MIGNPFETKETFTQLNGFGSRDTCFWSGHDWVRWNRFRLIVHYLSIKSGSLCPASHVGQTENALFCCRVRTLRSWNDLNFLNRDDYWYVRMIIRSRRSNRFQCRRRHSFPRKLNPAFTLSATFCLWSTVLPCWQSNWLEDGSRSTRMTRLGIRIVQSVKNQPIF